MRRSLLLSVVCTAVVGVGSLLISDEPVTRSERNKPSATTAADDEKPPIGEPTEQVDENDLDHWMEVKRLSAAEVFSALTVGDFKQLETSARRMQILNLLEQWRRDNAFEKESDYQGQLNAFEFATKELIRTAKAKDVDGALGAYINLTQSCVRCHKLIRDNDSK